MSTNGPTTDEQDEDRGSSDDRNPVDINTNNISISELEDEVSDDLKEEGLGDLSLDDLTQSQLRETATYLKYVRTQDLTDKQHLALAGFINWRLDHEDATRPHYQDITDRAEELAEEFGVDGITYGHLHNTVSTYLERVGSDLLEGTESSGTGEQAEVTDENPPSTDSAGDAGSGLQTPIDQGVESDLEDLARKYRQMLHLADREREALEHNEIVQVRYAVLCEIVDDLEEVLDSRTPT